MAEQKKTDNHDPRGKLRLRRYYLDKYHSDGSATVLDCCQGGGVMWKELRKTHKVASYWGLDLKPKKGRLQLDSVRVLAQSGWPQDVIDIDTYGSPWKHWHAMLPNVAKPLTVFLTIGAAGMRGSTDGAVLEAMGLGPLIKKIPCGMWGKLSELGLKHCLASTCKHDILLWDVVEATSNGNARYIGCRLYPQKSAARCVTSEPQHTKAVKEPSHV